MRDGQRPSPRGCLSPLALSLTLALASLATTAQAQTAAGSPSAQRFSIAAGPLAPALNRFAQQAGVALVMDAGRVAGLRTQGLNGSYSVQDGFAQLLKGTGQAIQKSDAGYLLTPAAVAAATTAPAAQSAYALPEAAPVPEAGQDQPLQAVIVQASRSNMDAQKAPQSVQIIGQADIERQMALSTNSSDVLSNLIFVHAQPRQDERQRRDAARTHAADTD